MKISIITATYNSAETIEDTIRSVIGQSYPDMEYILVDGGSTDGTLEILKKHEKDITKIISEKDSGIYDALNKGIEAATGNIIGILHSDDFFTHQDVIKNYVHVFEKTKADAAYSDLYYVNKSHPDKIIRSWKSGTYKENDFLRGWMPPHPTFFVRREIYQTYGLFDLEFKSAADYELMLRFIHKHHISLAYLPEFTVKMRVGGKSNKSLRNRIKANLEDRKAWKKNGLKPRFYTLYLKPLLKIKQYF